MIAQKLKLIEDWTIYSCDYQLIMKILVQTATILGTEQNLKIDVRIFGGAIRDPLNGFPPNDIDVTIEGVDKMIFLNKMCNLYPDILGNFVDMKIRNKLQANEATLHIGTKLGIDLDISNCLKYSQYYRENLLKRDFNINTLSLNLNSMKIEDTLNVTNEIEKRILKTTRLADLEFTEEPNTILRAIRFIHKYNLTFCDENNNQSSKIKEYSFKVSELCQATILSEIRKAVKNQYPGKYFQLLNEYKILEYVFPGIPWNLDNLFNIPEIVRDKGLVFSYLLTKCISEENYDLSSPIYKKAGFTKHEIEFATVAKQITHLIQHYQKDFLVIEVAKLLKKKGIKIIEQSLFLVDESTENYFLITIKEYDLYNRVFNNSLLMELKFVHYVIDLQENGFKMH
ncbi:hypothetical protein TRFO_25649 [Tritrichomonas foetus]|uniref:Poly A polymerase head domain-containing protein n=1 Tax=Tritrichomonas foetus TaxID=1144522 RepID=A0A1J4K9E3_9EUKA|nr:hypothetical protein TRFO_25649 [Tritrichomonas foetus]|eukprot:OHT06308.1 hypothetical protein TRFO_25649 [Tritrichomonas foetus]